MERNKELYWIEYMIYFCPYKTKYVNPFEL